LDLLRKNQFHIFGLKDTPFLDLDPLIRIVTGTWWANMLTDLVADLHDCFQFIDPSKFNICYPHWGYEMELYPRPYTVEIGDLLLDRFDMVIGHHSHTPQPITTRKRGNDTSSPKLIAYSLGDFCNGLLYDIYRFGLVTKITLSLTSDQLWTPVNGEWKFVETIPDPHQNTGHVLIRDSIPYFQNINS
jgi:hypothetical protein